MPSPSFCYRRLGPGTLRNKQRNGRGVNDSRRRQRMRIARTPYKEHWCHFPAFHARTNCGERGRAYQMRCYPMKSGNAKCSNNVASPPFSRRHGCKKLKPDTYFKEGTSRFSDYLTTHKMNAQHGASEQSQPMSLSHQTFCYL